MTGRERLLHAAVDALLQEQGAYAPVELLLRQSRLRYTDYEAWRCGGVDNLEQRLAGNPGRVRELLEQAAEWARRLGLQAESRSYGGWGEAAGRALRFTAEGLPRWESLYATHYQRAAPAAQMDLFFDAGPTIALNELCAALQSRQPRQARRHLVDLIRRSPDHALRAPAELLCDALDRLDSDTGGADPRTEYEAIRQHLAPAATAVLGPAARDLLVPFWRRLARSLSDQAFDPARPQLHASWALAQGLDWSGVVAALQAEGGDHPMLLARQAEAHWQLGDHDEALGHWCRLCWRDPALAAEVLGGAAPGEIRLPDPRLASDWREFESIEEESLDGAQWFPAWLLLARPGLALALPGTLAQADGLAPERTFALIQALLRQGRDDTSAPQIERRRHLQALHPGLFQAFLRQRR